MSAGPFKCAAGLYHVPEDRCVSTGGDQPVLAPLPSISGPRGLWPRCRVLAALLTSPSTLCKGQNQLGIQIACTMCQCQCLARLPGLPALHLLPPFVLANKAVLARVGSELPLRN